MARVQVYINLPRVMSMYGVDPVVLAMPGSGRLPSSSLTVKKPAVSARNIGKLTPVDDTSAMGYEAQIRLGRLTTRLRRLEDTGLADERQRLERLSEEEYGPESQRLLTQYFTRLDEIISRHRPELNQTSVNEAAYASAVRERLEYINTLRPKHRDAEEAFLQALATYELDALSASARTRADIGRLRDDLKRQVELEMDRLRKISDGRVLSQSNFALATQQDNAWDSEKEPGSIKASTMTIALPVNVPNRVSNKQIMMQSEIHRAVMNSISKLAMRQGWQVAWVPDASRRDVTNQIIDMLKGVW